MKKISLCVVVLMVFGAMLIAQESEPSDIVGYVAYESIQGVEGRNNNIIALPMEADWEDASDMGNDYQQMDAIYYWDAEGQGWTGAVKPEDTWLDDFALTYGHAYMFNMPDPAETFNFYSVGKIVEDLQFDLILGAEGRNNNVIMVPLDRSDLEMASDIGQDIGVANTVYSWEADGQAWDSSFLQEGQWLDDFEIHIGMPLMVNITEPTQWPDAGRRSDGLQRRRFQPERRIR